MGLVHLAVEGHLRRVRAVVSADAVELALLRVGEHSRRIVDAATAGAALGLERVVELVNAAAPEAKESATKLAGQGEQVASTV